MMGNVILRCNNDHSYEVLDIKLVKSITNGHLKDLGKMINPINNLKFNSFEKYDVYNSSDSLNCVREESFLIENKGKTIIVESNETLIKMVNELLKIDNTEINFIDYNLNVIVYKEIIICITKDYLERKRICKY